MMTLASVEPSVVHSIEKIVGHGSLISVAQARLFIAWPKSQKWTELAQGYIVLSVEGGSALLTLKRLHINIKAITDIIFFIIFLFQISQVMYKPINNDISIFIHIIFNFFPTAVFRREQLHIRTKFFNNQILVNCIIYIIIQVALFPTDTGPCGR